MEHENVLVNPLSANDMHVWHDAVVACSGWL